MNVLIVDDHERNRKLLKATLESEGLKTFEAADGLQSLQVLQQEKIDLIISDILMPNMDGYRLCVAIRSDKNLSSLPIILYSSTYLSPADRELARSCGANLFLEKPTPREELISRIHEVTEKAKQLTHKSISLPQEMEVLRKYSEVLVRKLEKKNIELEDSERKYRWVVENIPDVIWESDFKGNITFIGPNVQKVCGYSPEEIYHPGDSLWIQRIYPDDVKKVEEAYRMLFEKKKAFGVEYRIQKKDGEWIWLHDRAMTTYGKDGIMYACGVFSDITQRKYLEEQLRQAQKMEAIGQLAGGIAHDFNNLLSVILGYSDFALRGLREGGSPGSLRGDIEEIQGAATRASTLTRQLLAFSRRQVLQPVVMDLNVSVAGMEKMLRRLIGENVELITVSDPNLGAIKVDPGQIEQVILNLAVNSRDAMPKGGKLIIKTENVSLDETSFNREHFVPKPGLYVMLMVRDTGCGMNEPVKRRIFEPFFTTKEKGKGTGLGLSTVYGIVKQSGGYISVDSESGRGTTFRIYLPWIDKAVELLESKKSDDAASSYGAKTILVVEDEEKIRDMIRRFLQSKSYTVLQAVDGEDAINLFERHKDNIDLMITDIMMPGMSGIDLAAQLKTIRPEMKVLYMSGYTDQATFREEIPAFKTNFLVKPFTSDVLTNKIREVLDGPKVTGSS